MARNEMAVAVAIRVKVTAWMDSCRYRLFNTVKKKNPSTNTWISSCRATYSTSAVK